MFLHVEMRSTLKVVILQLLFCYGFGVYSEKFEIKTENLNKRLVPYTFLENIVSTHHDCVRECFHYGGQCKAINYNLKSRTCEFKSKGSADSVDVSEYEHAAGYVFTDITDWPTLTLSECSKNNCLDKQVCLPHGNTASGCIDKVDCGQASVIPFSTVTALVTTEGAVATISCDFGYEFNGTISEVTCKDGSWAAEGPIACIPIENVGCYISGQSYLYAGHRNTTINERTCQRWDSQSPHSHSFTDPSTYPSGDISFNENYCRDPTYDGQLWCYTTDPLVQWENCAIPLC